MGDEPGLGLPQRLRLRLPVTPRAGFSDFSSSRNKSTACPVPRCHSPLYRVFIVTFLSLEFLIYGTSFIVKSYISSSAAWLRSYPRLSKLGYGRRKEEQNRNKRNTSSLTYLAKESQ